MKYLSDMIGEIAGDAVMELGAGLTRHRIADHFWCDILASLVCVLESVESALEKLEKGAVDWLVDEVWAQVRASRSSDCGNTPRRRTLRREDRHELDDGADLAEELLKRWTKALIQRLCDGLLAQKLTLDVIVLKLQLLAIVLCPDAAAHKKVWDHCFVPLLQKWTGEEVRDTLRNFFPQFSAPATWTGPPLLR